MNKRTSFSEMKFYIFLTLVVHHVRAVLYAGDENVCLETETFTVTQEVVRRVPHEVYNKRWCWSLGGGFRCVKKETEWRTEKVYQPVTRSRIVPKCCKGYTEKYSNCIPFCEQNCDNGICVAPNTCRCYRGFYGKSCDTPCTGDRWGRGCMESCECLNDAECDRFTGGCKCQTGWTGNRCEEPCPEGYYGPSCNKTCTCDSCDRFTGVCPTTTEWLTETTTTEILTISKLIVETTTDPDEIESSFLSTTEQNEMESTTATTIDSYETDMSVVTSTEQDKTEWSVVSPARRNEKESTTVTTTESYETDSSALTSAEQKIELTVVNKTETVKISEKTEMEEKLFKNKNWLEINSIATAIFKAVDDEILTTNNLTSNKESEIKCTSECQNTDFIDVGEEEFDSDSDRPETKTRLINFIPSLTVLSGAFIIIVIIAVRWMVVNHRKKLRRLQIAREEKLFNPKGQRKNRLSSIFTVNNFPENSGYISETDVKVPVPLLYTFKPAEAEEISMEKVES